MTAQNQVIVIIGTAHSAGPRDPASYDGVVQQTQFADDLRQTSIEVEDARRRARGSTALMLSGCRQVFVSSSPGG